jgi:voltage-gated potassium channel Kch
MFAYILVAQLHPGSFSYNVGRPPVRLISFDAFYFSFITLTTVGYGDITPVTHIARTLAMTEAMTGTLYMAVLISRLVALYSSQPPEPPGQKN